MPELLTRQEALRRVLDGRFAEDSEMTPFVRNEGRVFATPSNSGSKTWFARFMVPLVLTEDTLLYVYDWYSEGDLGELPELYERVRKSEGLQEGLHDKLADLVQVHEQGYLECLVACCVYFDWGFVLANRRLMVLVSDDEWFAVASIEHGLTDEVANRLIEAELEEISWNDLAELFGEERAEEDTT